MTELTPELRKIIVDHQLGNSKNISFTNQVQYAQLFKLYLDNRDRFGSFSDLIREAGYCLLQFGLDWRSSKSNGDIARVIREEIGRLKIIQQSGDNQAMADAASALVDKIDDSEGFFSD